MSKNDDARPVVPLITPLAAEKAARGLAENAHPDTQRPEHRKTDETGMPATTTDGNPGELPTEGYRIPDAGRSTAQVTTTHTSLDDSTPMTREEFSAELGVVNLPETIQRLLFAAPVTPVGLLDRYVELHELETWLSGHLPFLDPRLVHAAQWLSDLLMLELAIRPPRSRTELTSRIMILADSWADRPENGHYELVCETVIRADIARLGLPPDDPVVTHFESRMTAKNKRKSEG